LRYRAASLRSSCPTIRLSRNRTAKISPKISNINFHTQNQLAPSSEIVGAGEPRNRAPQAEFLHSGISKQYNRLYRVQGGDMSKITSASFVAKLVLALTAVVLGACSMLIFGSHTSTWAQSAQLPPASNKLVIKPGSLIVAPVEGVVPTVASIDVMPRYDGFTFEDKRLELDGLDCVNCVFKNVVLTYGGGPFNLSNVTFSGTTRIELTGAAANGLKILPLVDAINRGRLIEPAPNPNRPIVKMAIAQTPLSTTWESQYGVSK
jgi:hypothetical protein